jgi:hypothetical protein
MVVVELITNPSPGLKRQNIEIKNHKNMSTNVISSAMETTMDCLENVIDESSNNKQDTLEATYNPTKLVLSSDHQKYGRVVGVLRRNWRPYAGYVHNFQ